MALSDRDIVITPNKGAATEPTIRFTGADASSSAAITLRVINSSTVGTLSFEGASGQLFSMTDTMSGTIFTVNDVSGIPSIEVLDSGVIKLAQYGGYVYVAGTTNAVSTVSGVLQVAGGAGIGGNLYAGSNVVVQGTTNASSTITGALQVYGGAGIGGNLYVGGTLNAASVTGTITNTTNVGVTNDTASATAQYLTFVSGSSGNLPIKVAATTGLVYIPSSGNLGVGTSPGYTLHVSKATAGDVASFTNGGATPLPLFFYSGIAIAGISTGASISDRAMYFQSGLIKFYNGADRMSIDSSGNVGIGTTTQVNALQVKSTGTGPGVANGGLAIQATSDGVNPSYAYADLPFMDSSARTVSKIGSFMNGSLGGGLYFVTNDNYAGSGTERMRILASGNVGIGTTTPSSKLTIYDDTVGDIAFLKLQHAANYGANLGVNTSATGDFFIQTVIAGTATKRLTIQRVDGNVGINSTSPGSRLSVEGAGTADESVVRFNNQGNFASRIWLRNSSRSAYFSMSGATADTLATGALPYSLLMGLSGSPSPIQFYNGSTTAVRMTIDSTGNVGIGTTAPIAKFEVSGSSGQLFSVVDSFVGTIFSVNDVSGIPSIEVLDTGLIKLAQYTGQVAISTSTAQSGFALTTWGNTYVNSSTYIVNSLGVGTGPSGVAGEIRAANEITAYYTSDERLKENVVLIGNPIEKLMQIRGVSFDWTEEHIISKGGEDGYFVRKHDIGVIAQEIEKVLPEIVATRNNGYKAVKYEKIVPLLIECIKEQQTQINQILARLEMLNIK